MGETDFVKREDRGDRNGLPRMNLSTLATIIAISVSLAGAVKSMVLTPYRLDQIEKDHSALVLKTTADNVALHTNFDPMRDTLIRIEVELNDIKRIVNRSEKNNNNQ